MSWGVATQNGVSVSLASIVSLSAGVTEFSPIDLFTAGTVGAWYDPSDYSTLFQDSAGTTPVTAVEQPVGLMLDKSQGLVLGSELVTNGDFSSASGWTLPATGTNSITGGQAVLSGAAGYLFRTGTSITAGQWYRVSFTVSGYSGSGTVRPYIQASPVFGSNVTGNGTFVQYLLATTTNANTEIGLNFASSFTGNIDDISIKSIAGNHASQATSTSRPVLRARYNQLTYSEQFDNAVWIRTGLDAFGSGSVVNATTAPDGTTTADFIRPGTVSSSQRFVQNPSPAQTAQTLSVYVKASGYSKVALKESATTGNYASFDLSNGTVLANTAGVGASITALANSWYRISMTLASAASSGLQVSVLAPAYTTGDPNGSTFSGDGTSGIYVWGADLRTGSSAGTYQRIAAATDYATAGFLPYLAFDGTDDSFGTGSINFSATDKMSVCAGVTKLASGLGVVAELSTNASTNNGSFLVPVDYSSNDFSYYSRGTTSVAISTSATYAAPVTAVMSGISDISAPLVSIRVNGATKTSSSSSQGTGNYGNYPLYIGRRGGSSFPFNGRIYQMVVCGKTLSAAELASTEAYVATKTGVTL